MKRKISSVYKRSRNISSQVFIRNLSSPATGKVEFEACVKIGRLGYSHYGRGTGLHTMKPKGGFTCASGRNPRRALASALRQSAKRFGTRRGAFKGLK